MVSSALANSKSEGGPVNQREGQIITEYLAVLVESRIECETIHTSTDILTEKGLTPWTKAKSKVKCFISHVCCPLAVWNVSETSASVKGRTYPVPSDCVIPRTIPRAAKQRDRAEGSGSMLRNSCQSQGFSEMGWWWWLIQSYQAPCSGIHAKVRGSVKWVDGDGSFRASQML